MKERTIAAISTAMYPSGIGIVRMSGPDSLNIIHEIYRSKTGKKDIMYYNDLTSCPGG